MPFTYNKLRGRIVEKYGTQAKFAEELKLSTNSLSKKMNCITGFSQEDIEIWAAKLDIDRSDYADYFFA